MLPGEAKYIADTITSVSRQPNAVCLNIGSSTARFREVDQPHIYRELFSKLDDAGIRVVHCDLKQDDGVDEHGDILDPAFRLSLRRHSPSIILCCNVLEHVSDRVELARACTDLLPPKGLLVASVPQSHPFHPDPIDTMYRPTESELASLFGTLHPVSSTTILGPTIWQYMQMRGFPVIRLLRLLLRTLVPFYRPAGWKSSAHQLLWLWRPVKTTVVVLQAA